ncbi:MAG: hypothetical protein AAF512_01255 [Pseudomonadota bacterium]
MPEHLSDYEHTAKVGALIGYILMLVGFFTLIFWVIGVLWVMLKKGSASNSMFRDHYSNMISTFWWGIFFAILGYMLIFVLIGYLILFLVWLWSLYKIVRGLLKLISDQSYHGS